MEKDARWEREGWWLGTFPVSNIGVLTNGSGVSAHGCGFICCSLVIIEST